MQYRKNPVPTDTNQRRVWDSIALFLSWPEYSLWPDLCFSADSLGLFIFSRSCLQKWHPPSLTVLAWKHSLAWNTHLRSFQVIHIAINYRVVRYCVLPYNNAVLMSKVLEEGACENVENSCWWQAHSLSKLTMQKNSWLFSIKLLNTTIPDKTSHEYNSWLIWVWRKKN